MKFTPLAVAGSCLIEASPAIDNRGHFTKLFDATLFEAQGLRTRWDQECVSWNKHAGTLRGLHHQAAPLEETKLVRCLHGAIFDVFLDLRSSSPTFLKWEAVTLRSDGVFGLYIPAGCSHGYQALEDGTAVHYLISAPYRAEMQQGVRWNDPSIAVPWPLRDAVVVSPRDAELPYLEEALAQRAAAAANLEEHLVGTPGR